MKIENLNFSYKDKEILRNINFDINDGEILMVLGVNGAGKSTLMKCLAGIVKASKTSKFDIVEQKKIGYLTQNVIQNYGLNVFEFVLLGRIGELKFKVKDEDINRVIHVLEHIGITHLAKRNFDELSGGQQRLVLIAQIFARMPKLMLLDEPTANLDLLHQRNILNLIKEYTKFYQTSTIINIHNINHAINYADKIMLLKNGEVYFFGSNDELRVSLLKEVFEVNFEILTNSRGDKFIVDF